MSPIDDTHRQQYRIRSAEVDPAGRATTASLVKLLQEAASSDAQRLGFGIEELRSRGYTWYLKRLHLRLRRTPWVGETVEIETWPAALERVQAIRDYRLFLDGGFDAVEVGKASSAWLLIDLATGKPLRRFPDALQVHHRDPVRRALETDFEKLPELPESDLLERPFPLRRTDLDVNRHVNHGVLVDALLESVPEELWTGAELHELEVDFRTEARPGDHLVSRAHRLAPEAGSNDREPVVLLDIVRAEDGHELVRGRSRWLVE